MRRCLPKRRTIKRKQWEFLWNSNVVCDTKISDFKSDQAWWSRPNLVQVYQDANDFTGISAGEIYCYECLLNIFKETGYEGFWWEPEDIVESGLFDKEQCDCDEDCDYHDYDAFLGAEVDWIKIDFDFWLLDNTISLVLGHVTPWWQRY